MGRRLRNVVLASLEHVRRRHPEMNLSGLVVLLYVAENPGASVADLAAVCGLTTATVSRTTRALLAAADPESLPPRLGLVEDRPRPQAARTRAYVLSKEGHGLCRTLDVFIERGDLIQSDQR